jgi:L-asparaginase
MSEPRRPRIAILATGGTIAGVSHTGANVAYTSGSIGAAQLLQSVPELGARVEIVVEQVANVGSQAMTHAIWWDLLQRVDAFSADATIDAIIITHGTDTLEETAYFLSLTARRDKPVILVGAMLPASAPDADGPRNLYAAAITACALCGRNPGYGPVVVMNGNIFLARDVQKIASDGACAFGAPNAAPIGSIDHDYVRFMPLATHAAKTTPAYPLATPPVDWPEVDIVYAHANMGGEAIDFLARRAKGFVLAGVGNGNATDAALDALKRAVAAGVSVVRATRTGSGRVDRNIELDDDALGFVAAGDLNPQKARILLMLALVQHSAHQRSADPASLQRAFTLN